MNKRIIWYCAAPVLAALLIYVLLTAFGGEKASVIEANGTVSVTRKNKPVQVKTGVRLKDKDSVSLGRNSGIWFRIDKSKTVLLDQDSGMTLTSLKKNVLLDFETGAALIRVDKALGEKESFKIQAGNASISIRDAGVFSIHADASGGVTLNVYQGEVIVYGQNDEELITLKKGLSIRIDTSAGALSGEAGPIDYSLLSGTFLDNVMDYAKEAGYIKPAASPSAPESSPQSEPEIAEEPSDPEAGEPEVGTSGDIAEQPPAQMETAPGDEAPEGQDYPAFPAVKFKYTWDGKAFKPSADIIWTDRAAYIEWRLYDNNGAELEQGGRFDAESGVISVKSRVFNVSPPKGGNLYPMGYAIRLTPYYTPAGGGDSKPMTPVIMELPYFEVEAERSGGQITPVISTNIGFYFEHSYEKLTDRVENNKIRITGSLTPLEGTKVPLQINVISG